MLRQMSRRARLDALLHDSEDARLLANILDPVTQSVEIITTISPADQAKILAEAPKLPEADYNALLQYLHQTGRPYRAFNSLPHPENSIILPPHAQYPLQIHCGECTFSCEKSHKGNSAIQFYNPFTHSNNTGSIEVIWRLPLEGSMHTFVVVWQHKSLPASEESKAPFTHYYGFQARIVDARPSGDLLIIEPTHIIMHLTTFKWPAGTYGIGMETLVVCWALNRGRK